MYDMTVHTEYCQPYKLTQAFGVQSFYWGSVTYSAWPNFSLQRFLWVLANSLASRSRNWSARPKIPIINHIFRLSRGQSPQIETL